MKLDFSHVWHKIPFWIPKYNFIPANPMTFFLRPAHHFVFKWNLPEIIKKMFKKWLTMSEFLLRLQFWVRSFGCKYWRWLRFDFDRLQRCFWLETLFVVIFGQNIDLTNQLHALPGVKKLNGKIFTWAPFLPIYEIYFLLLFHENLVTFLNLHFLAKKSSSELRIQKIFLYLR